MNTSHDIRSILTGAIRNFVFGIVVAILVGPYLPWPIIGFFIVCLAVIPTSQRIFFALGAKVLGLLGLLCLGAVIVAVMIFIVDPINALHLNLTVRAVIFILAFGILVTWAWTKQSRQKTVRSSGV